MDKFQVVDISWGERNKVSYDAGYDQHNLPEEDCAYLEGCGFYCIYGRHPVYGQDVLLYIGETKEGEDGVRSFRARLTEHFGGRFWYHQNLSFSLGVAQQELSFHEVQLVESILVAAHKPALNRMHIDCAKKGSENILVRNWDFPGALQHECTGSYWRQ